MVKKLALAVLTTVIILEAPWRLAVLGVETFAVAPGQTRVSQEDTRYWDALALEARLVDLGWQVTYASNLYTPEQGPAYGVTRLEAHAIAIDAKLHWNARYAVLAHEGGHAFQPGWLNRAQGEAFAETVAALVVHDGLREHARYLAHFRGDVLVALVEWPAIYHAAAALGDR